MDKSSGSLQLTVAAGWMILLLAGSLWAGPVVAQAIDEAAPSAMEEAAAPPQPMLDEPVPDPSQETEVAADTELWWEPYAQPLISGGAALLGAIVGGLVARANMSATNNQRANEVEIAQLQAKLNDFYGRFRLISEENKLISLEFKKRQGGGNFRTLIALLDPKWLDGLSQADRTIVATMIDNGIELRKLVREKAGLVDLAVQPYLAKVSAHFAVLELAYAKRLENDPERFLQYVYPDKIDGVLELEIKRLSNRIALLLNESGKRHGRIAPLVIPSELQL